MKQVLKALGVLAVTFLLWGLFALIWDNPTVPSPWAVLRNIPTVFQQAMAANILASFWRIFCATVLALLLGMPLGLLIGYHKGASQVLSPLIYFSYPIPKLALLPILMLIFGLGEISKILMIFM
ncbi:MAG: ABC transporter permease, partial [Bacillota bacterium]|nr:ABC transporter permease [Bacillota bacterium]